MPLANRYDRTETIDGATLQHGPNNKRVYLMKLGKAPLDGLHEKIMDLADRNAYEKICLKIPRSRAPYFLERGFSLEAAIPGLYNGREEGVFLGKFLSPRRELLENSAELERILAIAKSKSPTKDKKRIVNNDNRIQKMDKAQVLEMADLYRKVFPSYPFPIDQPEYLEQTMESHIHYFGIRRQGQLVALSSAESDMEAKNVEMTDFATLPEYRGQGLAQSLLNHMEKYMSDLGFVTAYTIARAASPGMNITFSRLAYRYGGHLVNNTQISGRIESMNVWYKPLSV